MYTASNFIRFYFNKHNVTQPWGHDVVIELNEISLSSRFTIKKQFTLFVYCFMHHINNWNKICKKKYLSCVPGVDGKFSVVQQRWWRVIDWFFFHPHQEHMKDTYKLLKKTETLILLLKDFKWLCLSSYRAWMRGQQAPSPSSSDRSPPALHLLTARPGAALCLHVPHPRLDPRLQVCTSLNNITYSVS